MLGSLSPTTNQIPLVQTLPEGSQLRSLNHAGVSSAPTQPRTADISTCVPLVINLDTLRPNAQKWQALTEVMLVSKQPQFAWDFLWENHEISECPSAQASETVPSVPSVPENEIKNTTTTAFIVIVRIVLFLFNIKLRSFMCIE